MPCFTGTGYSGRLRLLLSSLLRWTPEGEAAYATTASAPTYAPRPPIAVLRTITEDWERSEGRKKQKAKQGVVSSHNRQVCVVVVKGKQKSTATQLCFSTKISGN